MDHCKLPEFFCLHLHCGYGRLPSSSHLNHNNVQDLSKESFFLLNGDRKSVCPHRYTGVPSYSAFGCWIRIIHQEDIAVITAMIEINYCSRLKTCNLSSILSMISPQSSRLSHKTNSCSFRIFCCSLDWYVLSSNANVSK